MEEWKRYMTANLEQKKTEILSLEKGEDGVIDVMGTSNPTVIPDTH